MGLGSPKKERRQQAATDFVTEFQEKPDQRNSRDPFKRGPYVAFYRGTTPADSYSPQWDRGYGWFPGFREFNEFEPARAALYELLVRVPIFLFGQRPGLQKQADRRELLRYSVNYLQARNKAVPVKILAMVVDTFPDALKNEVKLPRNDLAKRVIACRVRPEYSGWSEGVLLEELAKADESVEAARKGIERFNARLAQWAS